MSDHTVQIIVCALCVAALEGIALCKGKNGSLLRLAFAVLGLLGGISLAEILKLH
jgi:hypothetical protein